MTRVKSHRCCQTRDGMSNLASVSKQEARLMEAFLRSWLLCNSACVKPVHTVFPHYCRDLVDAFSASEAQEKIPGRLANSVRI